MMMMVVELAKKTKSFSFILLTLNGCACVIEWVVFWGFEIIPVVYLSQVFKISSRAPLSSSFSFIFPSLFFQTTIITIHTSFVWKKTVWVSKNDRWLKRSIAIYLFSYIDLSWQQKKIKGWQQQQHLNILTPFCCCRRRRQLSSSTSVIESTIIVIVFSTTKKNPVNIFIILNHPSNEMKWMNVWTKYECQWKERNGLRRKNKLNRLLFFCEIEL